METTVELVAMFAEAVIFSGSDADNVTFLEANDGSTSSRVRGLPACGVKDWLFVSAPILLADCGVKEWLWPMLEMPLANAGLVMPETPPSDIRLRRSSGLSQSLRNMETHKMLFKGVSLREVHA